VRSSDLWLGDRVSDQPYPPRGGWSGRAPAAGPYPPGRWDDRPGDDDGSTTVLVLRVARAIVFLVYAVVTVCLALLVLGFVLRLFGASTDAEFTRWVYRQVDWIMQPFRGMFPPRSVSDRSVVDFSLLFAMILYAIVALALHAFVSWLARHIAQMTRGTRRRSAGPPPGAHA
jgi:uncharacterized protein YggT (Ycf19 family)